MRKVKEYFLKWFKVMFYFPFYIDAYLKIGDGIYRELEQQRKEREKLYNNRKSKKDGKKV